MKPSKEEINCILYAKQCYLEYRRLFKHTRSLHVVDHNPFLQIEEYGVSANKRFTQLWSDFGLSHLYGSILAAKYKRNCINYWVSQLYSNQIDIDIIERELLDQAVKKRKKFYLENPKGHNTLVDPIDRLPDEIDTRFGHYST